MVSSVFHSLLRHWLLLYSPLVVSLIVGGCLRSELEDAEPARDLDANFFRCEVQPALTRGCAFMDCHGNEERALRIYAEQRFRLDISWLDFETPITQAELDANFRAVSAFVGAHAGERDLLSEKPLDVRAGGLFHRGKDLYGQDDVYLSPEDSDYQILRAFAGGASAPAECRPGEAP